MTRSRARRHVAIAAGVVLSLTAGLTAAVAHDDPASHPPVPAGFAVTPWAAVPAPTALEWGPDGRLYVLSLTGQVWALDAAPGGLAGVGPPLATTPGSTNGLAVDPDVPGLVYVSEFYDRDGLTWGRVWAVTADSRELIVDDLPGGQHWVNDVQVHPVDGQLYITNGNRTDSGIDCSSGSCAPETDGPDYHWRAGALLRVDRDARNLKPADLEVVAEGMRNLYDVAFWPTDPSVAYIPTNGSQDPASDDVLYATNVHDGVVDDMGFPSCLISPHEREDLVTELVGEITGDGGHHDHGMGLRPQQNPDPAVIEAFGDCDPDSVLWPVATFGGHSSANGLAFAHGSDFPGTFGNDLFVTQWGSLEASHPTAGHDVVRVNLRDDGTIVRDADGMPMVEPFLQGVAPLDVVFGPDGAMYVADNLASAVLRVAWHGIGATPPDDEACPGDDDHHHHDDHGDHGDHPPDPGCVVDDDGGTTGPGNGNGRGNGGNGGNGGGGNGGGGNGGGGNGGGGNGGNGGGGGNGSGGGTDPDCVEDDGGHDGHHDHGGGDMHHPEPCPDADGLVATGEPHRQERERTRVFWDVTGQISPWEINYEAPEYAEDDCGTDVAGVGIIEVDPTKDCTMTHGYSFREGDPDDYFTGHGDHDHDCRVTPEQRNAAFDLAERTRAIVGGTYDNKPWLALQDGYTPFPVPGTKTFHMFNSAHYSDRNADGSQVLFDPTRPEMFTYGMTDDGLKVVNVVYAYTGTPEELPEDRRSEWNDMLPRPYGCMLEWHAHDDQVEGPATGNFDGRAWMTHVWTYPPAGHTWGYGGDKTYTGIYPFGEYGDGTEPHAWFAPLRFLPALCNKDGGCI